MKRLLPFLLLSTLSVSQAQAAPVKLPCAREVRFSYQSGGIAMGEPNLITAYVTIPPKFPDLGKTQYVSKPFSINCNGVVGTSTLKTFELRGPIEKRIKLLVSPYREGELETDAVPGKIVLGFHGDYRYPNLGQDWYQERVYFTLKDGQMAFEHEGGMYALLPDLVIGARVNGGALKPLYFQGQLTPVTHDSDDLVELYLKGENRAFDYMSLNFGKGVITLKNGIAFPSK